MKFKERVIFGPYRKVCRSATAGAPGSWLIGGASYYRSPIGNDNTYRATIYYWPNGNTRIDIHHHTYNLVFPSIQEAKQLLDSQLINRGATLINSREKAKQIKLLL